MRKIFTTLKSVVAAVVIASMALATSCSYDDSAINNRVDQVEKDLAALTERVTALETKLQSEVENLQALIDGKVVVVDVVTDADGNQTIKLSNGKDITVLAPTECTCDPLQYRVVDGVLEVSADGENWIPVQVAPECVVANIVINDDSTATITLANGDEFTVVKAELIECEATRAQLFVAPGETKSVKFTINDAVADVNVMNQPLGWAASIEVAPVVEDEENVDPGMGILAAGGTDFLLNITGPSADFVNAGYAQKEGFVSVHFNASNGTCKVAKVAVNLAELGISVDASGNITVTNSVAKAAGLDEMGEPLYDFADFFIGIVDAEDYATYGDKVFVDTFDDWTYDYTANVASTQRTTGFQNIVDIQWYEAGVCEKEIYTLTVDQLATAFWPKYEYEMGKEYIIFVTTETEMASYVEQPILTNAAKASYKRVFVEANLNKETTTWNDATVDFTLAGYNYYIVGWLPVADLEQFVEYGMATDIDSALLFYLQNGGNLMGAGAVVTDLQGTYKLSELAALSMTEWAPMINADTEYLFFVYPMNAETEMDFYTHQVVEENIRNYGSFSTKPLVQGEFDAAAQFEIVTLDAKNVNIKATFGEDVVTVAYNWFESSFVDPEEAAAAILGDQYYTEYVTFDEYTTYLEASKFDYYGLPDPIYLGVLAINADGEYVYVEKEAAQVPAPEVAITSFEYLGRYWEIADDNPDTNGGEFVYLVKTEDGNEFKINIYYTYCNADGSIIEGTYDYCTNKPDYMYSSWAGFAIISDSTYDGSKLVVAADKITLKLVGGENGPVDYVYVPGSEPVEPEQPEQPAGIVFTSSLLEASSGFGDFYINLMDDAGLKLRLNFYNCQEADKNFLPEGTYDVMTGGGGIYYDALATYTYAEKDGEKTAILEGAVVVSESNGAYKFEVDLVTSAFGAIKGTYEGAVEGLVLPSEYVEPEPPAVQETTEWTIAYHSTSYGGKPGYSEHEIYFWVDAATYAQFDFTSVDSEGRVNAGTYDFTNGLNSFYCRTNEGTMTSATVVVTDGDDANSKNFEVTFVVDESKPFHFTYTSTIYPVE